MFPFVDTGIFQPAVMGGNSHIWPSSLAVIMSAIPSVAFTILTLVLFALSSHADAQPAAERAETLSNSPFPSGDIREEQVAKTQQQLRTNESSYAKWLGHSISAIHVVGVRDADKIIAHTQLHIGMSFSRSILRQAIHRLMQSGELSDVQVEAEAFQSGVQLIFVVTPLVSTRKFEIHGVEQMEESLIKRLVPWQSGLILRPEQLNTAMKAIKRYYRSRGFHHVTSVWEIVENEQSNTLVVRIEEGAPTLTHSVTFIGDALPPSHRINLSVPQRNERLDEEIQRDQLRNASRALRLAGWLEANLELASIDVEAGALVINSSVGPHYKIDVRGHQPLSPSMIWNALNVDEERLQRHVSLAPVERRIEDLYEKLGYRDATASIRIERSTRGSDVLKIEVKKGLPTKVANVAFPGARHFSRQRLRDIVAAELIEAVGEDQLLEAPDADVIERIFGDQNRNDDTILLRGISLELFYESAYERAKDAIETLYRNAGFLSAEVAPIRVDDLPHDDNAPFKYAYVVFPVREGPRTFVYDIDFRRNRALSSRHLNQKISLHPGDPFRYDALETSRKAIEEAYKEAGFYFIDVQSKLSFSDDGTRAQIEFRAVEGEKTFIDAVEIRGAEHISESVVRGVARLPSGVALRPSLLKAAQERIIGLGIFRSVTIGVLDPEVRATKKKVVIDLAEQNRQYIDGGIGASIAQGVRGDLGWGYRNLFGTGVQLNLRAMVGYQPNFLFFDPVLEERFTRLPTIDRIERRISAGIAVPYFGIPYTRAQFTVTHQRENERNFGLRKESAELSITHQERRAYSIRSGYGLEHNRIDIFVDDTYDEILQNTDNARLKQLLRVPQGSSTLLFSSFRFNLDFRDHPFFPKNGFYFSAYGEWSRTLESQSVSLGEDVASFFSHHIRTTFDLNTYLHLGANIVWAAQAKFGRVFHLQTNSQTYPNRQFFLGGVDSFRGIPQDALVPQDVADTIKASDELSARNVVQGGDTFFVLRNEIRIPVKGALSMALFLDLANLWSDAELVELDFRPAAGAGLRVATPVGPLSLDLGVNLLRRKYLSESQLALHFSIGQF